MAGETTSRTGLTTRLQPYCGGPTFYGDPWTVAYATGELEANDVKNVGYLPPNVTCVGFFWKSDDLDTNASPALAQKITIGSTDVATGLTYGQAGTGGVVVIEPVTVTSETLVKVTNTTAAATAAAGDVFITPILIGN
jgi:hypothetical protein